MLEVSGNPAQQINQLQQEIQELQTDLNYYKNQNSYSVARATQSELQEKMDRGELLDLTSHDEIHEWLCDHAYEYDYQHTESAHDECISDDSYQHVYNCAEEAHSTLSRLDGMCTDGDCGCTDRGEYIDLIEEARSDLAGYNNY